MRPSDERSHPLQELLWLMRLTPVPVNADASSHAPFCAEAVRRYAACRRWRFHRTVGVLWCVVRMADNNRGKQPQQQLQLATIKPGFALCHSAFVRYGDTKSAFAHLGDASSRHLCLADLLPLHDSEAIRMHRRTYPTAPAAASACMHTPPLAVRVLGGGAGDGGGESVWRVAGAPESELLHTRTALESTHALPAPAVRCGQTREM